MHSSMPTTMARFLAKNSWEQWLHRPGLLEHMQAREVSRIQDSQVCHMVLQVRPVCHMLLQVSQLPHMLLQDS